MHMPSVWLDGTTGRKEGSCCSNGPPFHRLHLSSSFSCMLGVWISPTVSFRYLSTHRAYILESASSRDCPIFEVRNANNTTWLTTESAGEMQWSSIARGMLGGMKRFLNTEYIPFKYFSWQLDLTPPRTAGSSSVKKNSFSPLIPCDSLKASGGTWSPCFPIWLYCFCHNICMLTWHSHSLLMGWCQEDVTAGGLDG